MSEAIHLHLTRRLPDPSEPSFFKEDLISPLLRAVKAYEEVTNRKEMIYESMVANMLQLNTLSSPTSLNSAIIDWILLGRVTGARRCEWCQDGPTIQMTVPNLAHEIAEPVAFLLSDFEFFDSSQRRIHRVSPDDISRVEYVNVRWRFQKNDDNGQVIPYQRDRERPDVCSVLAAFRIVLRALTLNLLPLEPLAIYSNSSSQSTYRHIRASQVVKFLRRSAQVAFGLKPDDKSLQRWTCHSIRVTAANILHRANMSDSYIQTRLRWKSNTFLMYLRNTFYSADRHTQAMKISNVNIPHISTSDGLRYRPPECHEVFASTNFPAPTV